MFKVKDLNKLPVSLFTCHREFNYSCISSISYCLYFAARCSKCLAYSCWSIIHDYTVDIAINQSFTFYAPIAKLQSGRIRGLPTDNFIGRAAALTNHCVPMPVAWKKRLTGVLTDVRVES